MSVSYMPFMILFAAVLLVVIGGICARNELNRKSSKMLISLGVSFVVVPIAGNALVTFILWCGAVAGLSAAQYELARWLESTPEMMSAVSVVPYDFPFDTAWYWLSRAAEGGSVKAKYTIGYRLKNDRFVPDSADRSLNPQAMMDEAIEGGFVLRVPEKQYYAAQYRIRIPVF